MILRRLRFSSPLLNASCLLRTDLESAVMVDADRGFISRTLSNLLDNELVHLPAGSQIHIQLRSHEALPNSLLKTTGRASLPRLPAARLGVL